MPLSAAVAAYWVPVIARLRVSVKLTGAWLVVLVGVPLQVAVFPLPEESAEGLAVSSKAQYPTRLVSVPLDDDLDTLTFPVTATIPVPLVNVPPVTVRLPPTVTVPVFAVNVPALRAKSPVVVSVAAPVIDAVPSEM